MLKKLFFSLILLSGIFLSTGSLRAQDLSDFQYSPGLSPSENVVTNENDFHGYTQYWHDTYTNWYNYGSLFKLAAPDVKKTILQSKVDIAEDLGIPGLLMQEGFLSGLMHDAFSMLNNPPAAELQDKLTKTNVLVLVDPSSGLGKQLEGKVPPETFTWPDRLGCHQYGSTDLVRVHAFLLTKGDRKLFVISSQDTQAREQVKQLVTEAIQVTRNYDFHKGWFGAYTLHNSVTCTPGHPVDVMGLGF